MDVRVKPKIDPVIFDRMQTDKPIFTYIKTIVGKLGVVVWDHMEDKPTERILEGDPRDPKVDLEKITVKLWDEVTRRYFENTNRRNIEAGKLVPYTSDTHLEIQMVNALSDAEIEEILGQPFFTLDNKLKELTSTVPVKRILEKAVAMNRPIGTINRIKARIEEIQEEQGMEPDHLKEYYKNLNLD